MWIYPKPEQVVLEGKENLTYYRMGFKVWEKGFCKICGVQILNQRTPLTEEELAALPEEYRRRRGPFETRPLSIRVLDGFDIRTLGPERFKMANGRDEYGPTYINP